MTPTRRLQSEVLDYRVVNADEEWIKLLFECSVKTPSGVEAPVANAKGDFHCRRVAENSDSLSII